MTMRGRWTGLALAVVSLSVLAAGCSSNAPHAAGTGTTASTTTTSTSITQGSGTTPTTATTTTTTSPSATTTVATSGLPTATFGSWTGVEPNQIILSGDAGNVISGVTWSSWNQTSAVGHGTWSYEDCVPDCAQGTVTPYPATMTLGGAQDGHFTGLTETTSGPHGFSMTFTLPDTTASAS